MRPFDTGSSPANSVLDAIIARGNRIVPEVQLGEWLAGNLAIDFPLNLLSRQTNMEPHDVQTVLAFLQTAGYVQVYDTAIGRDGRSSMISLQLPAGVKVA